MFEDWCDESNYMDMQLQDPSHREEQVTCLSLSMSRGSANIGFFPVEYLRVISARIELRC
jgi:hypothetical protein